MFIPGTNRHERNEKCTMGLTSLLTLAVILMITAEMTPKTSIGEYSVLGW